MAYKTFANGFPLPASDLNNYLMNQSVIVFADASARSAALPTPTEGMMTYLEDTNAVEVYDGSAWIDINDNTASIPKSTVTTAGDLIVADGASSVARLGVGTNDQVLTVVSGEPAWADAGGGGETVSQVAYDSEGYFATSSTSLVTAQTFTFTPTSSSNKVALFLGRTINTKSTNFFTLAITRQIGAGGETTLWQNQGGPGSFSQNKWWFAFTWVDTPATTSTVTYRWKVASGGGTFEVESTGHFIGMEVAI